MFCVFWDVYKAHLFHTIYKMIILLQPPAVEERNGDIIRYYVGYKKHNTTAPYMYQIHVVDPDAEQGQDDLQLEVTGLDKFTKYAVHVQAVNAKDAGPVSADIALLTLEDGMLSVRFVLVKHIFCYI